MYKNSTTKTFRKTQTGFTLLELAMVIAVMAVVATLAALRFSSKTREVKIRAAETDLRSLRAAAAGTGAADGYLSDMSRIPGFAPAFLRVHNLLNKTNVVAVSDQLSSRHFLLDSNTAGNPGNCAPFSAFTNRSAEADRGWNGPYIKSGAEVKNTDSGASGLFPSADDRRTPDDATFRDRGFFPGGVTKFSDADFDDGGFVCYGIPGEQALGDPWGNPYILQIPPKNAFSAENQREDVRFGYARFVSAGPDGILQTPCYFASWNDTRRRLSRLAGRNENGAEERGDDIVLFIGREDVYEDNE